MRFAPIMIAAAASAAFAVAGCSAAPAAPTVDVPKAAETAVAAGPPTSAAPAGPQFNERGNIVKQLGETGGWGGTSADTVTVKFVVDKITVDPQCTEPYAQKPQNGHFVQLDVRVETTPQMSAAEGMGMSPGFFSTIGADGITESSVYSGSGFGCLAQSAQLADSYSPASKYRGSIILDTRNPSGVLVLRHPAVSAGGWEWAYGGPA